MGALQKLWWLALLRGGILLLLAFIVFRHPVSALIGVAVYIGVSLILTGTMLTGMALAGRGMVPDRGWAFAGGLMDVVVGFVLLSNPALTAASLPFVVGFWIMVSGIMSFVNAYQSKKEENSLRGLSLTGGVVSILIGYFVTHNTLVGMLTITTWMGIGFAIAGIVNISIGIKLRSLK